MALQENYIEILDNCLERLKAGEALERILSDYPQMANDLRPMLMTGNLHKALRYPASEVSAAQSRIAPKVQAAVQGTSFAAYLRA